MARRSRWLPFGVACGGLLLMAGLGFAVTRPPAPPPSYAEARAVVDRHCVACHSENPTVPAFPIAPAGVKLDTLEQMQKYAERSRLRATVQKTMPLMNKTGITDNERTILARWAEGGARAP